MAQERCAQVGGKTYAQRDFELVDGLWRSRESKLCESSGRMPGQPCVDALQEVATGGITGVMPIRGGSIMS
ncbi:hypothetical protein [Streptomyces cyaneochromogenes]|uniref:hypothetical protein n=1 Tax=Streptomyces cyaneochromogenes TaxID=2496836 RepID=UPI00158BDA57|nr:hypothetical protein [Streptomyces cyaneochromogenes]